LAARKPPGNALQLGRTPPEFGTVHANTTPISADRWLDDVRLSDIEQRFTCQACGTKGANLRPNFHWAREAREAALPAMAS